MSDDIEAEVNRMKMPLAYAELFTCCGITSDLWVTGIVKARAGSDDTLAPGG